MNSNMSFTIGNFKGTGDINGLPVFVHQLPLTIGGVMGVVADAYPAYFGCLVSVDPDEPNTFLVGCAAGDYPVGVLAFDPAIAQNDPGMNDKYFEGRPATAISYGLAQFNTTSPLFSEGKLGMEVWADRLTGLIGFFEIDASPAPNPALFVKLNASVYKKEEPNGVTVFFQNPIATPAASEAQPVVATPIASPVAGAVAGDTPVTLFCATPGAVIYYTDDTSTPDSTDTLFVPASPIIIAAGVTIKAIAYFPGYTESAVLTAVYTVV